MKNIRRIFASFMFNNLPMPSGCVGSTIRLLRQEHLVEFGSATILLWQVHWYQNQAAVPQPIPASRCTLKPCDRCRLHGNRPTGTATAPVRVSAALPWTFFYRIWSMKTVITILKSVAVTIISQKKIINWFANCTCCTWIAAVIGSYFSCNYVFRSAKFHTHHLTHQELPS